jgi:hypothetical protein
MHRKRSLCRLTQRREEKKLALFDLMQAEFTLSAKTFAESLDIDLGELSWGVDGDGDAGAAAGGGGARKRRRHGKR